MAKDKQLLKDIALTVSHKALRPVYRVDTKKQRAPDGDGIVIDMPGIRGRDNLAQAIRLRLLTPQGELKKLGHPLYGSRLHEIIGRVNTENTRNLARLRILESLKQEPRIDDILQVIVTASVARKSSIDVLIEVMPIGETSSISIGPLVIDLA